MDHQKIIDYILMDRAREVYEDEREKKLAYIMTDELIKFIQEVAQEIEKEWEEIEHSTCPLAQAFARFEKCAMHKGGKSAHRIEEADDAND